MRSFRKLRIDRRNVQYRHQPSVDIEDGCAGTAQVYMSQSKMLTSVDGDRSLFGDAGADAIRAFDRLRPHTAEPSSPIFESTRIGIVAAVVDRDPHGVTEEKRVSSLANQFVQSIYLPLCTEDELFKRFTKISELVRHEDAWRPTLDGIDPVSVHTSLPGGRYLLDARRGCMTLYNRIDVFSVLCRRFDRAC